MGIIPSDLQRTELLVDLLPDQRVRRHLAQGIEDAHDDREDALTIPGAPTTFCRQLDAKSIFVRIVSDTEDRRFWEVTIWILEAILPKIWRNGFQDCRTIRNKLCEGESS